MWVILLEVAEAELQSHPFLGPIAVTVCPVRQKEGEPKTLRSSWEMKQKIKVYVIDTTFTRLAKTMEKLTF